MNTKICSTCQKENQPDATTCEHCGAVFSSTPASNITARVPDEAARPAYPEHVLELTRMHADILVLQVLGYEQPILLKGSTKAVLGRYTPGELNNPSIDLTPYNANLLGVSRQHAAIIRQGKAYGIQDLASTNGSWQNESKLTPHQPYPIRNGDLIRLGQLAFYVYFRTPEASEAPEELLRLKSDHAMTVTARTLETELTPYLKALASIQSICNLVAERPAAEVIIKAIIMENDSINVKLVGAKDALALLKGQITPWQVANQGTIKDLMERPGWKANDDLPGIPQTIINTNGKTNELRQQLRQAASQLATQMLIEVASERPEPLRRPYAEQMIDYLHTIALSSLKIFDS